MKKTTYQIPEIRDDKDNIIQSGTYGKNSPLCNDTNDGVLDYINNNLEYLKSAQDSANESIDSSNKSIENIITKYATKNELKSASDTSAASLAQKISADAQSITTKALTVTGETTVPTANVGNKSETIANTEFVQNTVANLVDSAPETLNTLNELARALNNDPNFATTITNLIAEKESKQDAGVAHTELSQKIDDSIAQAHHYIKRNTAYNVGDVLTSPNLPYGTIIVVTQAGTTGANEPDWDSIKNNIGGVTDDGTVQFSVKTVCAKEYVDSKFNNEKAVPVNINNLVGTSYVDGISCYKAGHVVEVTFTVLKIDTVGTVDDPNNNILTGFPRPLATVPILVSPFNGSAVIRGALLPNGRFGWHYMSAWQTTGGHETTVHFTYLTND